MHFKRDIDIWYYLNKNKNNNDNDNDDNNNNDDQFNSRLYVKTTWKPDPCNKECAEAFDKFENLVNEARRNLPTYRRYNLRKIQRRAIGELRKNNNIIIHGSDKQLGTFVVPRSKYIKQCLKEHMMNTRNYVQLSSDEVKKELTEQKQLFIAAYQDCKEFTDQHIQYFERSIANADSNNSRIPTFYGPWKVHKKKDSTRPVVSSCGSFPEIFSIFIDEMLKRLVQDVLKSYIISSDQLVYQLTKKFPNRLPYGAKLFSIDAVGMYINIQTKHAVKVVEKFMRLYANELKDLHLPQTFIKQCLVIIMTRNIFQFGDTYWKQKDGTAMGTSCAVNYAFLYMGLLEMKELLSDFTMWLLFYGRFIDDGFGIWLTQAPGAGRAWNDFKSRLNQWGRLKWTNTGHVDSLEFLDLTVFINHNNCLEFKTFRKPMNLNIYLPPNSAHPPDVIRSIIFGRVRAYFLHNSSSENFKTECFTLARNLMRCGWEWMSVKYHFTDAYNSLQKQGRYNLLHQAGRNRREKQAEQPNDKILVFRLPYHPRGIQRRQIRLAYQQSGLETIISNRRFICAQLRTVNLRDRVTRTALEDVPRANPSDFLSSNPPT